MIIASKSSNILYDKNNKKVLEYPLNTKLDYLYVDLWIEIIKYVSILPFIIGNLGSNYPFYHPIKIKEFDMHKGRFFEYYFNNNGIFDSHNTNMGVQIINTYTYLIIEKKYIKLNDRYGNISYLCCQKSDDNQTIKIFSDKERQLDDIYNNNICISDNCICCNTCNFVSIFVLNI